MRTLISIIFSGIALIGLSQKGTIRGMVTDAHSSESLIGVNVSIKGTTTGTFTDLDGKFSITVDPGTYDLQVTYVSYQTNTISDVVVSEDEVTVLNNIQLSTASMNLSEVIVKAELVKNNETAIMVMKQKSVAMMDGISSEKMALIGDGNAAEAAKRVTGISIEGGKYVYVRGLGDRYSKTTLNGMEIPGLDPDRNSLQLDIFPSNLINNITVNKNFTAEMPGDFAGGLMNIETKDFPDRKTLNATAGIGYNPQMHFNEDYLTYESSSTDFLGFDDGLRELPTGADNPTIPVPFGGAADASITRFVSSFEPTLGADRESSFMDYSFGVSFGNQFDKTKEGSDKSRKLGLIASLSYKTDYTFYDDVTYGEYQRRSNPDSLELVQANLQTGEIGEKSVLLGGIVGAAMKSDRSKIRLTIMRLQSGTSRAGRFDILNDPAAVGQSGYEAISDNLEYNERSLTNVFIGGQHVLNNEKWELDWRVSPTLSTSDDPDIRKTAFSITTNSLGEVSYDFNSGQAGVPTRIWRSLNEFNAASKIDLTRNYEFNEQDAKLRFGVSNVYKIRNYEILQFNMAFQDQVNDWGSPDANAVLLPTYIYPNDPNGIYYQSGNVQPNPNEYESDIMNTGLYISNEMKLSKRLNTVFGLRAEMYIQNHTGRDIAFANGDPTGNNLVNAEVLNTLNLLPTANLIYSVTEKQNLRLAYARTLARPSFKEVSFAQIIDPITNRIFNGGLFRYQDQDGTVSWDGRLDETKVNNVDLRWEIFQERGQMYSISAFYKQFQDPIELVRIPEQQTTAEFQPRNVGDGTVYGVEVELRKSLEFISEKMKGLSVNANLTMAESSITMTEVEFNSRKRFERTGESIENERQMAGQSPYVINAGMTYSSDDRKWDAGIFYNVKGPTLEVVGIGLYSDVYTQPFHSLNFSLNKALGEDNRTSLDIKVANLLDDRIESFYTSYEAEEQIFSSYAPGMAFSLGFSHKF
ncbi:MAG: TonB-dependent receptor [Flavobacteriales bacterium]|nr:TonB-dependent receptor [Flavobacteriales bacterium]